jgi:hypothetical protein
MKSRRVRLVSGGSYRGARARNAATRKRAAGLFAAGPAGMILGASAMAAARRGETGSPPLKPTKRTLEQRLAAYVGPKVRRMFKPTKRRK